jgi:phosphoribosylformylglycinamidine synthase
VLCEARLLPGALLMNANRRFTFRQLRIEIVNASTAFTGLLSRGDCLRIPAKHASGRYYADAQTLAEMKRCNQVVLRYGAGQSFNGSVDDIAGVCNEAGNVFGLMPHPEHAVDELLGGSADGLSIFESMRASVEGARA